MVPCGGGEPLRSDSFEGPLLRNRGWLLLAKVRNWRPVKDELREAELRIAPDEFIECFQRGQRIRFGSVWKNRPANGAGIPAELMAVLLQKTHLLPCALNRLAKRQRVPSRFRKRLAAKSVPAICETGRESEAAGYLAGDHQRRAWLLHGSSKLDALSAIETTLIVDSLAAQRLV